MTSKHDNFMSLCMVNIEDNNNKATRVFGMSKSGALCSDAPEPVESNVFSIWGCEQAMQTCNSGVNDFH